MGGSLWDRITGVCWAEFAIFVVGLGLFFLLGDFLCPSHLIRCGLEWLQRTVATNDLSKCPFAFHATESVLAWIRQPQVWFPLRERRVGGRAFVLASAIVEVFLICGAVLHDSFDFIDCFRFRPASRWWFFLHRIYTIATITTTRTSKYDELLPSCGCSSKREEHTPPPGRATWHFPSISVAAEHESNLISTSRDNPQALIESKIIKVYIYNRREKKKLSVSV